MNNTQKKVIYLDACLEDIENAMSSKQLEEIYNRQELFGYFAFHDENYLYKKRYIEKAEYCRNHGYTLQQMLTELQKLRKEIWATKKTTYERLKELDQEGQFAHNKKDASQPAPKRFVRTNCKKLLIIVASLLLFTGFLCCIQIGYVNRYETCEAEIIEERYNAAVEKHYATCQEIRDTATGAIAKINVTNSVITNNSVGNEWYIENWLNGELIDGSGEIYISFDDAVKVETYIAEDDTWVDSSKNTKTFYPSKYELLNGCTITLTTSVVENNGRYKGNIAKWQTIYEINAEYDYPDAPQWIDYASVSKEDVHQRIIGKR